MQGRERFPINIRYPREIRDNVDDLRALLVITENGSQIALGELADIVVKEGPPMLKSENARLSNWESMSICVVATLNQPWTICSNGLLNR